jgi:hypothetical protein
MTWMLPVSEWCDAHVHLVEPHSRPDYVSRSYATWDDARHDLISMSGYAPIAGLVFGYPLVRDDDLAVMNRHVMDARQGQPWLAVGGHGNTGVEWAGVQDCLGLKPYHCYADDKPTWDASVSSFLSRESLDAWAPYGGIMMVHCVQERGAASPDNACDIESMARDYPLTKFVLAHLGRGFTWEIAEAVAKRFMRLDNVWFDLSAVTEPTAIYAACSVVGSTRMLWGTDYPVTELAGRCVSLGDSFMWIGAENNELAQPKGTLTLWNVGAEAVRAVSQAVELCRWTQADIDRIFKVNFRTLIGASAFEAATLGRAGALHHLP